MTYRVSSGDVVTIGAVESTSRLLPRFDTADQRHPSTRVTRYPVCPRRWYCFRARTRQPARSAALTLYVGTSGWQYRHWSGRFYPRRPAPADELAFYAERFGTVEANGTFYRLPPAGTFDDWRRRVADGFVFAIKASRFLTHMKRLSEPDQPVERLMSRASRLGPKLGPVLLQLPPNMRPDTGRLRDTFDAFARHGDPRVAVEFRDERWFVADVRRLLEQRNAALCLADRDSRLVTPAWRTADWAYVRFHSGRARPQPCYGRDALSSRARLIADTWGRDADAYVYFNNDPLACALRDAIVFARVARSVGLRPTAVPDVGDVRVG
jgi:uncharacterized protein YecE (DUF72 family)